MKLSALTPTPCVTCGEPVVWMAQHRACWRRERLHGANNHAPRRASQHRDPVSSETVDQIAREMAQAETECRAFAASA